MKVAVIPARGGSKRIPRKNIRSFAGKPIIAYSIEAARASNLFDEILVSTDDDEIARISRQFGANVPFVRPADLADDHSGTTVVVAHALDCWRRQGNTVDMACCVYATAPFVTIADLKAGHDHLISSKLDYVFSATRYSSSPHRALLVGEDGVIAPMFPEHSDTRSQDLPPIYHDAAQFYWGTDIAWAERRAIYGPRSGIIELPSWRVQDIDTQDDWSAAEIMFSILEDVK